MSPSSFFPDPLQMWRKAITDLEASGNALSNRVMGTAEAASALHQMANLTLGMQSTFEKVLGMYLKQLNLPSRKEITALSEALQRVEEKLDRLLPTAPTSSTEARPARTRVPSARDAEAQAQAPEPRVRRAATKRSAS